MKKFFAILGLGISALLVILLNGDNTGEDAKCISDKWHNIKNKSKEGKTMKKLLALVLCAVMAVLVTACGNSGSDYENIKENGELVVGITDYAPMDYKDNNGNWTGFDAEFAEAVAEKMGVKVKFIEIDWDNKFMELNTKSVDCLWNGMTITNEVKKNTSVTKAYAKNEQIVVMKESEVSKYKDVKSLSKLTFAVESGSAGQSAAEDNNLNFTPVSAQSDTLLEVKSGSVDACIIDSTMATAMTGKGTSYDTLGTGITLTKEEYGIGCRKESDLTDKLNQYIDELTKDGTLKELSEKYSVSLCQ